MRCPKCENWTEPSYSTNSDGSEGQHYHCRRCGRRWHRCRIPPRTGTSAESWYLAIDEPSLDATRG